LLEVIVLVAVMAVVAAMLLPPVSRSKVYSGRIACVNNLKNVGLADRIFSTDHDGNYPWMLGGTNGTKDFLDDPTQLWRHFAIVSNELSTPKILVCPSRPLKNPLFRRASPLGFVVPAMVERGGPDFPGA